MRVKKDAKHYKPDLMFTHENFSLEVHSMWRPVLTKTVALSILEVFKVSNIVALSAGILVMLKFIPFLCMITTWNEFLNDLKIHFEN